MQRMPVASESYETDGRRETGREQEREQDGTDKRRTDLKDTVHDTCLPAVLPAYHVAVPRSGYLGLSACMSQVGQYTVAQAAPNLQDAQLGHKRACPVSRLRILRLCHGMLGRPCLPGKCGRLKDGVAYVSISR